jgi:hypothetical protein
LNKTRKRNKRYIDWEGRNKTFFAYDTIICVETPEKLTKNFCNQKVTKARLQDTKLIYKSQSFSYMPPANK